MKKLLTVLTTVALVAAMAMPAFAVGYVDSVTASGAPTISGGTIGNIVGSDGNKGEDIKDDHVVITPAAGTTDQELKDAYDGLASGSANISSDLGKQLGNNFTATEVFNIEPSTSGSHLGEIAPGESLEFTFSVGIDPHTNMVAACLVDGQWVSAVSTKNNGDGTVTVVLPEMGTVAFFTVERSNEEIVTIDKEAGTDREIIGHVVDENGEILSTDYQDCIIVTPVEELDDAIHLTEEEKQALAEFYNGIISGEIVFSEESPELDELVKEKLGEDASADTLSILDLIDVKVICNELNEHLPPEDTTITLTFKVGAPADTEVFVVTYKNGKVVLAEDIVNNGDGTVTATFENFCPVAFLVSEETAEVIGGGNVCAICNGKFVYKASPIPAVCMTCFAIIVAVIGAGAGGVLAYIKSKSKKEETK